MKTDAIRTVLLTAVEAAKFGVPIDPAVRSAIARGERVTLQQLGFDSLALMEFCISVELQTNKEVTTTDLEQMVTVENIETWLRERL